MSRAPTSAVRTGAFENCDPLAEAQAGWFVYLLPLADCSAFKVGFSCNPLQRIYTFSHRYFERFDLRESVLLAVADCDQARAVEATLKMELAPFRVDAPTWVPASAGGHTEWFAAVHFGAAQTRLRAFMERDAARILNTAERLRSSLLGTILSFEPWAWSQAHAICNAHPLSRGRSEFIESVRTLRDWLDAYRYLDIPVFGEDAEAREFVWRAAMDY